MRTTGRVAGCEVLDDSHMRRNFATIVNGVFIVVMILCLFAVRRYDRQYGQAHSQASQAAETASRNGSDIDPKRETISSPEIYYRRAMAVRGLAFLIGMGALVIAWVTRKWCPAIIVMVILLLTFLHGGMRY